MEWPKNGANRIKYLITVAQKMVLTGQDNGVAQKMVLTGQDNGVAQKMVLTGQHSGCGPKGGVDRTR